MSPSEGESVETQGGDKGGGGGKRRGERGLASLFHDCDPDQDFARFSFTFFGGG